MEEKLDKLDSLSLKFDNITHDVDMLKIRTSPLEEKKTTPMNAIQVQINDNIRMLAKLKDRWAREIEEEERVKIPTHTTLATLHVVEDLKTFSTHHIPSPPNGPINVDAKTSTIGQEGPLNLETTKEKMSLDDTTTTLIKLNNFSYFALCDVGASASVLPKRMYDMLELKPFDPFSFWCSPC